MTDRLAELLGHAADQHTQDAVPPPPPREANDAGAGWAGRWRAWAPLSAAAAAVAVAVPVVLVVGGSGGTDSAPGLARDGAVASTSPQPAPPRSTADHPLLVRDGTAVRGTGHVVAVEDKPVRLCGDPLIYDVGFGRPDETACPSDPVVLEGVDTAALAEVAGGRAGTLSFAGTWKGGRVQVTEQQPGASSYVPPSNGRVMDDRQVPCPTPPSGWPARTEVPQEDYPAALLELRKQHPTDVLATAVLHPPSDRVVLGVVAADEEAAQRARAALEPDYGRGVCVVTSPYSADDFSKAGTAGPGVLRTSGPDFATNLELIITWRVLVVDDQVQQRLDQLPEGLVEVAALIWPDSAATTRRDAATPNASPTVALAAPMPKGACGASGPGWPEGSDVAGYEAYVGLSFEKAKELAARSGHVLQVLGEDGVCAKGPFTADLRGDRVNLYLDSGRVVSAYTG